MFDIDLLVSFVLIALLFVRQIFIIKEPNKIDYGPLMVGIGVIGSLTHFIIDDDILNILLLVRESILPLLLSVLFFIIMNIMHQTQERENEKSQEEFTRALVEQLSELKDFVMDLETRMVKFSQDDRKSQEGVREKFKNDIKALAVIQLNQEKFIDKFNTLEHFHERVLQSFENFTAVQMPELDNVVHKHIDILRVAEQDHFNKLNKIIEKSLENRIDVSEEVASLKENITSMRGLSDEIARSITRHTLQQLSDVTKAFEGQILLLKTHAEGVKTSLDEGENTLGSIKNQSEMIMKQMVLSSNRMKELKEKNDALSDLYSLIKELMLDVESIKSDYVKSQAQLELIAYDFKSYEKNQIGQMTSEIDALSETLTHKIDSSLEKLHEHYHLAQEGITKSVKILSQKAKVQNGYQDLESK